MVDFNLPYIFITYGRFSNKFYFYALTMFIHMVGFLIDMLVFFHLNYIKPTILQINFIIHKYLPYCSFLTHKSTILHGKI